MQRHAITLLVALTILAAPLAAGGQVGGRWGIEYVNSFILTAPRACRSVRPLFSKEDPMPHRVSGQPFAGRASRPCQRSGRPVRLLLTLVTVVALAVVVPAAGATLPDPLWIGGVYDGGDYDDLLAVCADFHTPGGSLLLVDRSAAPHEIQIRLGASFAAEVCPPFRPRSPPCPSGAGAADP
jgi:hypothetical protein